MKRRIKLLSSAIALASIGISVSTSATLISNDLIINKSTIVADSTTKNSDEINLVPAQANGQNANISTNAGPVTFNNNVITALDWYGNKLWQVDMSEKVSEPSGSWNSDNTVYNGGYTGSWRRAWFNWDYNRTQNILWILGYANFSNQTLFGLDADNGEIKYEANLGYMGNGVDKTKPTPYRFVTALSSGKVLVYGDPLRDYAADGSLYDPTTKTVTKIKGNSASKLPTSDGDTNHKGSYRWFFYNLIPLTSNKNLVEVVAFDARQSGTKLDESAKNATYNVFGILVDDNLNFIGNQQASGSPFKTTYQLATGMKDFRNTSITPQRDYFALLNSQTVSVTYNTVTLFNTADPNNIKISKVKMTDLKWIQSWTVDSNDNLYFKFLEDGIIYKLDGDTLKSGTESFSPTTYLDLSGISGNDAVKTNAKNFIIYNVYGYTGQLMMINASFYNQLNIYDPKNKLATDVNWGLAIAVVPNKNNNKAGDFKGVLNGPNSIQSVADFTIDSNVLNTKIPSEITKSDIKLLNDAFFKNGDNKPFVISDINDSQGTFKVTANLYKIPWFADTLPTNSVPKVVSYTFNGNSGNKDKAQSITKKVSWKKLNSSTDYDFMNMLPSNVSVSDLNVLNPFQVSFQSQTILKDGKQIYPKTTYSIGDKNDANGTLEVKVKYEYVPMSSTYTNGESTTYTFGNQQIIENQVLSYETTHKYEIFKNNDSSAFYFMGASSQSEDNKKISIDVNTVPQLKSLLEAGTLPSSFENLNESNDSSNSAFLQFVNTTNSKGYPISKMKFNVTADDTKGTFLISAIMPDQYSPDRKQHTYLVEYTGLNKIQTYLFSFVNATEIGGTNINTLLPSNIDEGDIIKNFITYNGFDSNDFDVVLTPDDEKGKLNVEINLTNTYASSIATNNGFVNYSINKTFSGFMTTKDFNNRFSVVFKNDDDISLLDLKRIQANEIKTAFSNSNKTGSLTIGSTTYTSLNQFVEKLLVSTKGSSIPSNWDESDSGVKTEVYVDNNLGLASFYVNISKDKILGASSDLNFVVTYSGFVKGNVVPTSDNLSFVSNILLKNYLLTLDGFDQERVNNLTPTELADWVNKDNNVKKLITYKTGQYVEKLNSNDYKITVTANDIQNTITITIDFGSLSNPYSLSEYSIQYTI